MYHICLFNCRVEAKPSTVTEKKPKTQTPIVLRRSLRPRGKPPDNSHPNGLKDDFVEPQINAPDSPSTSEPSPSPSPSPSPVVLGPLSMRDAYSGAASDRTFIEKITNVSNKSQLKSLEKGSNDLQLNDLVEGFDGKYEASCGSAVKGEGNGVVGSINLRSMTLKPENIAWVMLDRILTVRFFPATNMNMVAVGNRFGNIAFWDINAGNKEGDGIYLYHPHTGPVSGILIQPFSLSKVCTPCTLILRVTSTYFILDCLNIGCP